MKETCEEERKEIKSDENIGIRWRRKVRKYSEWKSHKKYVEEEKNNGKKKGRTTNEKKNTIRVGERKRKFNWKECGMKETKIKGKDRKNGRAVNEKHR